MDKQKLKAWIRSLALDHGFSGMSVAKAEHMDEEADRLEKWLSQDRHGEMSYLENHFDKRIDPTKLVPGAKTVISFMYNYFSEQKQSDETAPKIAMYAYGKDYHKIIKKKLKSLFFQIQENIGSIEGRFFVDSAPVLERDWAKRSGLGWVGKNTLLINPKKGSYFFLCEIISDLDLEPDHPIKDHCGTCTRCIDACPTEAIDEHGYIMDGSKCISYLTIELKNKIPEDFKDKMDNWMFGCDVCQQVCPWNRFSTPHREEKFLPKKDLMDMSKSEWQDLNEDMFEKLFEGSAVKRTKFQGLKRNIEFLK